MKNFVALLLVFGVIGLASAINHKPRAKRQGYGDLGGGDDAQPQQPQTQPTYQPTQTPSRPSQPNYPSATQQYGGGSRQPQQSGGRPGGSGQYPSGGGSGQYPSGGGSGQYPTGGGGGQHQTGGGSSGQYPTGGGGGQHQTGGGSSGQYRPSGGSGQSHDYQDYGDGANSLPGTAGRDYPTYGPNPPETSFACASAPYVPGYYANTEYGCQVWHICEQGGKLSTFLCPNGTIFNQKYLVCDWWYNVNCGESTNFYNVNAQLYQVPAGGYGSHDQYKGSGFGNVGGNFVSGNAGAPGGGNSYGGRVPAQGGGGSFPGQSGSGGGSFPGQSGSGGGSFPGQGGAGTYQGQGGTGGYTGQVGGGRGPAGGNNYGVTSGGSGAQHSQYPSGQTAPTSGPAAPSYPTAEAPSGGY